MRVRAALAAIVLIALSSGAFCIEEITKISIQEAIDIAVENSMELQSQKLNVQIAKNNIKAANRLQNPSIDTNWMIGSAGKGNPHGIGVTQMIEVFKRKHRKKSAQASFEVSDETARYKNFDLKMDVREAYINLVSAKTIVDSLEIEEKSLLEINRLVKERYKAGKASETDVIQSDISINHIKTQLNTARTNIMAARFQFNSVMDTDPIYDSIVESFEEDGHFDKLLTPSPKTQLPGFSDILALAEQNRYDLKIAQKEIEVAKNNLKIETSKRVPDIEIGGGYLFQPIGMSGEAGRYLNGAYVNANLVNLPILYNFAPEIKNAKLEIEKAELKYAAAQNNAFANLSSAYEKLVNAQTNLNYYTDSLIEDSKRMMKTSKKNYEDGKTDLTPLILIEQSYRSIIIGYTTALTQYYSAYINFLREVDVENLDIAVNL
ncbi:TPA: TolC family protein [Candidatus Galligastranaerophilus faecipullorum]|nr:TolC family protein [Candidatus Galligastranaerophilus faecipullorum]